MLCEGKARPRDRNCEWIEIGAVAACQGRCGFVSISQLAPANPQSKRRLVCVMSDHLKQSSVRGLPGSPGRPSPLSRPHWPWSTYTHRSSSSSASVFSSSGSTSGGQGWESRSSASTPTVLVSTQAGGRRNSALAGVTYQPQMPEELSTRQWSFNVSHRSMSACAYSYTCAGI